MMSGFSRLHRHFFPAEKRRERDVFDEKLYGSGGGGLDYVRPEKRVMVRQTSFCAHLAPCGRHRFECVSMTALS